MALETPRPPYASLSEAIETLDRFVEEVDETLPVALSDVADRGFVIPADMLLSDVLNADPATGAARIIRRQLSRMFAERLILGDLFSIEPISQEYTESVSIVSHAGQVVREIPTGPKGRRGATFTETPASDEATAYDADELLAMILRLASHMGMNPYAQGVDIDPAGVIERAINLVATETPAPAVARRRVADTPQA